VRFSINEREYLRFRREFAGTIRDAGSTEPGADRALRLILADGSIHEYPGTIVSFDAAIDPTTGTLTLEADFPNPDRIVLPGQFARVRGVLEERENALAVPQRAVMETQGIFQLAVVDDDGTVDIRQVQMGPRVDDSWIVDFGLEPGERVALEGLQRIRPGMKVVAKDAPQDAAGGG